MTDATSGVNQVYVYIDGTPTLMQKTGSTYYHNTTLSSGNHTYYISASDNVGNEKESSSGDISIAPNWDIVIDGICDMLDASQISFNWNSGDGSNPGWIRADINNDGYVNILDASQVSAHWQESWYS